MIIQPTLNEIFICLGIWAFGLLLYTIFVRITIPVLSGRLTHDQDFPSLVEGGAAAPGPVEGAWRNVP